MKEYIIHGTSYLNIESILKDGFISINNKKKKVEQKMINEEINQIFTQLVYRNIPNEKIQRPHWGNYVIVLDEKILKDYPFYSCKIGGFYDKFNNAFLSEDGKVFVKSKGNLKRMPNLTKLKNIINDILIYWVTSVAFMHSHEILFNKNIPLKKYCLCIIYSGEIKEIPKKIIDYAKKLEIPIKNKSLEKDRDYRGINNLIDIIEK
jgi:hypothetical protein